MIRTFLSSLAVLITFFYLGLDTEGIYHTGIVVFGKEYFFGSEGIKSCSPTEFKLGNTFFLFFYISTRD